MKLSIPNPLSWLSRPKPAESSVPTLDIMAYEGQRHFSPWEHSIYDGEKFLGGLGPVQVHWTDYWSLRERSGQMFRENLYAQGLVRRLVTNEINTGLQPEARPDEKILGFPEDRLADWTEDVESRFELWGKQPEICDHFQSNTWGALQRYIRLESIISGDVLVVLGQHPKAGVPTVRVVDAQVVRDPISSSQRPAKGHTLRHGVERDARGVIVAYWILQDDLSSKRIPARNARTGRRVAWLVFGFGNKRYREERGMPLLAILLQSLKELDRYRDATLRKAVLNSILAMFIKKTSDKPGTHPLSGGATRKMSGVENTASGDARTYDIAKHVPGLVLEELQMGEEPQAFDSKGTDEKFGDFEEAMVQAFAWANEIPPEILRLAFSNNYSASQAAINEFKIYLHLARGEFGDAVCSPVYQEWLISETINGRIAAPGLLDVWRDPAAYDRFGAWVAVDWYGPIKPSTDMLKQAKGSELLLHMGLSTYAKEARELTGTKFSKNMKRQAREVEQLIAIRNVLEPPEPTPDMEETDKDE